jgi:hypothetical protein
VPPRLISWPTGKLNTGTPLPLQSLRMLTVPRQ